MDSVKMLDISAQLETVHYDGFYDWLLKTHSISILWNLQPTYILAQLAFILGGVSTLIHALRSKGRWPYLWIATILHGTALEFVTYIHPDVDNFWHSTTPVMFFGQRLPLHIILLYPCFYYQATFAVSKLNLPLRIQPFAVALCVVLIDIPYDIMSVKLVHWTWHDTDPNIYDRHYWVPWNSYFFHATFSAGFTHWFNFSASSKEFAFQNLNSSRGWKAEWKSVFMATLLGAPTGILAFIIIYHPLHDIFKIHSEVTFFIPFTIFFLIVWSFCLTSDGVSRLSLCSKLKQRDSTWILLPHLLIHYSLFLGCSLFASPEDEISVGLHEPIGPCNEKVPLRTALGMVLMKRKYLCLNDYDEGYFDFHCIPGNKPRENSTWYGICGTPFENRIEYIIILSVISLIATVVFYTLHIKLKDLKPVHKKKH